MTKEEIIALFREKFGEETPEVYTAPGRINLIGEHTDYNGSFVFPGAVDKGITAAIRLNGTNKVRAYALDLDEYSEFGFNEEDIPKEGWAKYIFGVCREIIKRGGKIEGFDTVFSGNVPLGTFIIFFRNVIFDFIQHIHIGVAKKFHLGMIFTNGSNNPFTRLAAFVVRR
jgi:galactokinase